MSTASTTAPSSSPFYPITKSSSVPDIHKESDLAPNNMDTMDKNEAANSKCKRDRYSLLNTNSDSIESSITSPTGSLEQFEVSGFNNSIMPLTPDDANVNINNESSRENQTTTTISRPESTNSNTQIKQYDTNSSSFRFRRHSSQSSINLPNPVSLNAGSSSSANCLNNSERICSSPINSLKMSSRVCQIKISEGIEPHLNHEIKSERDMQCTLKLKLSCDDLIINNDEDVNKEVNRIGNNSPNPMVSSSSILRNNSQSNMPSPSMSSCYSYSNSCSPTGGICGSNSQGFARCLSPSASLALNNSPSISHNNPSQISQNYFSQSPSPTRKLLITRRSMSPIPCLIRPNTLGVTGSKRKFSDVESTEANPHASPKRSNNDNAQEFVQPLQIYTGNSRSMLRSQTSSPFSPLAATLSSPNQNSISSLIITAPSDSSKMQTNEDELKSIVNLKNSNLSERDLPMTTDKTSGKNISVSLKQVNQLDETANKYTFKPIQLPPPSMSCNITSSLQLNAQNNKNPQVMPVKKPKSTNNNTSYHTTATSFASLAQLNSPLNSPAQYVSDSPINCSPCVSVTSSSNAGEKPDSGYQSSIQNNSDSESCV